MCSMHRNHQYRGGMRGLSLKLSIFHSKAGQNRLKSCWPGIQATWSIAKISRKRVTVHSANNVTTGSFLIHTHSLQRAE